MTHPIEHDFSMRRFHNLLLVLKAATQRLLKSDTRCAPSLSDPPFTSCFTTGTTFPLSWGRRVSKAFACYVALVVSKLNQLSKHRSKDFEFTTAPVAPSSALHSRNRVEAHC